MRTIPPALQAALDTGASTLCRCWTLARRDGVLLGFTDHDEDIVLDALTCRAASGLDASEARAQLGLAVGGSEIAGALDSDTLSEDALAAGLYDGATLTLSLVDWSAPANRVLLHAGVLGEIRREGAAFTAEIRGLAHRLAEESGRLYAPACAADLGEARCGVNLDAPAHRGEGAVVSVAGRTALVASGLDAFAAETFSQGRLTWRTGANAGLAIEVKSHRVSAAGAMLDLWQAMAHALAPGDTFRVTAGCDKRLATCRDRFANAVNFRGFPHMPGNDFVVRYPLPGEPGHSGEAMRR